MLPCGITLLQIGELWFRMMNHLDGYTWLKWGETLIGGCLRSPKYFLVVRLWATFWPTISTFLFWIIGLLDGYFRLNWDKKSLVVVFELSGATGENLDILKELFHLFPAFNDYPSLLPRPRDGEYCFCPHTKICGSSAHHHGRLILVL